MTTLLETSACSGAHFVYEWSGSAFEIGRQHGETLRDEIIGEFAPALQSAAGVLGVSEARVLDRHRALYERQFAALLPRAIEEIQGIARGAELSYEQAFFAATRDGVRPTQLADGCTAFFCGKSTTRTGGVLLGQTKDTPAPLSRYRIMKLHYDDGLRVVTLNYPGWIAHAGISSNGLANTGNSLYAAPPDEETVPFSLLKRLVMEKNSTQEVLRSVAGLHFENCCVIIGDAAGAGICIEYVAGRQSTRDVSGEAFGHANSVLDPELKPLEDNAHDLCGDSASSPFRQKRIQHFLDEARGDLNVDRLKTFVADHEEYPHSICRHGECGDSSTTAAFIADLDAAALHVCIGNPCIAPFTEYSVAAKAN
jgi:isopenicillin-N N-acyltransferase-like protein